MDGYLGGVNFLTNENKVNHFTPLPPGTAPAYILTDLRPHEHLKYHPAYRAAFHTQIHLKVAARESRLLNDIPLPVITVTGKTATITRTAGVVNP